VSKRRRARAKGPKTISKEGLSGQLGINLIERIVTEMGSRWIPGGANEVGIDGYIELFDPSTRRPLGTTVAVQSKVVSSPENETDASFDYWCKAADLDYWLSNNIPVVLIVSKPASGEAYWAAIQQYFADASRRGSTRVTFSKSDQGLTKNSLDQLLRVAVPKSMVYVAPLLRKETLHSNLLALVDVPPRLFVSGTDCRTGREVWGALRRIKAEADGAWVAWDKKLYSFHDLSEEPWVSICEDGTHESFESTDWSESNDVERQHLFVDLLNRTLRSQLWPTVRFFPNEDCLAMTGKARRLAYQSLKRTSRISVVTAYSTRTADGRKFDRWRHLAFRGQFRRLDGHWYLEITPTYRFTRDGFDVERFHEDRLKGIKRIEGNRAVLSSVMFWADFLKPKDSLFSRQGLPLKFGELATFEIQVGVDDKQWLSRDAVTRAREKLQEKQSLLPELGDQS
jgi:hypothetical protein